MVLSAAKVPVVGEPGMTVSLLIRLTTQTTPQYLPSLRGRHGRNGN